jgi:PKD repeat protein
MDTVESQIQQLDFNTKRLENTGLIIAETNKLTDVVDNIKSDNDIFSDNVLDKLDSLMSSARNGTSTTLVDAFRPGMFNFSDSSSRDLEANLRNDLLGDLKNPITDAITELTGVASAEVSFTYNTPGPKNRGIDPFDSDRQILSSDKPDVGDAVEKIGAKEAWEETQGEGAVVAVFDTSFSEQFLGSDRVIDTFAGQDVGGDFDDKDPAFQAPEEGHGTMTAYSAAGNSEDTVMENGEKKVEYDGVAKNADLLLARLSDNSGGLKFTEEAWDWLAGWIKRLDRPVISNHSYGIPLCSARGQGLCQSITTNLSTALSKRDDHQAFYAAGNEAQYCGHRLSGVTNGIAGVNSRPESMTVGAFRFDLNGAQVYSSHGFGTCGPTRENPKPDVGCLLPSIVPYGNKEKDMSTSTGSAAGTSEASPLTAGVAALVASVTGSAKKEVISGILEGTAELPRKTQVNVPFGYDARFGNGQIRAKKAVDQAKVFEPVEPVSAIFSFTPSQPTGGTEVTFDASESSNPEGETLSYQWDFGDGTTASGEVVSKEFNQPGIKTVELTVTTPSNISDTFTADIDVSPAPTAEFTVSPNQPTISDTVTFNAEMSTDPVGEIQEYNWRLGDGSTASGKVVDTSYSTVGEYNVALQVVGSSGTTSTISKTIELTAAPEAQFAFTPEDPNKGQEIVFSASGSMDPDDNITSYAWMFGDGSSATGPTVSHAYNQTGQYTVTLNIEDSDGNMSSSTATIDVGAVPEAQFTVNPRSPRVGETVTLDASASSDPDNNITSYSWELGNGDTADGSIAQTQYDSAQDYQVILEVEDSSGNSDTKTKTVGVNTSGKPSPDFIINPQNPQVGETVTLDASPTSHPTGTVNSYNWDLGNGNTATGVTTTVTYNRADDYGITLTVEDTLGDTNSISRVLSVSEEPVDRPDINALFNISPVSPTTTDTVTIDAAPSSIDEGEIQSYNWELGDGRQDQGQLVDVSYDRTGVYQVELTVEGPDGFTDSTMQELSISSPSPPEAQFVVRPPNPTVNDTVELDASVSDDQDQDIQSYTWNVGDGRTMTGQRVTLKYDDPLQYQILLTVEDSTGRSDTVMQSLSVGESDNQTTNPINEPDNGSNGDTTEGTDESTSEQ